MSTDNDLDSSTFRYAYECEKQARLQSELLLKAKIRELSIAHQQLAEQNAALKKSASELRQVLQILKETKDELRAEAQSEFNKLTYDEHLPTLANPLALQKTLKVFALYRLFHRFYRKIRR